MVPCGRLIRQRPRVNEPANNLMKIKRRLLDLDALQTSKGRLSRQMINVRAFKYIYTIGLDGGGLGLWSLVVDLYVKDLGQTYLLKI